MWNQKPDGLKAIGLFLTFCHDVYCKIWVKREECDSGSKAVWGKEESF